MRTKILYLSIGILFMGVKLPSDTVDKIVQATMVIHEERLNDLEQRLSKLESSPFVNIPVWPDYYEFKEDFEVIVEMSLDLPWSFQGPDDPNTYFWFDTNFLVYISKGSKMYKKEGKTEWQDY